MVAGDLQPGDEKGHDLNYLGGIIFVGHFEYCLAVSNMFHVHHDPWGNDPV